MVATLQEVAARPTLAGRAARHVRSWQWASSWKRLDQTGRRADAGIRDLLLLAADAIDPGQVTKVAVIVDDRSASLPQWLVAWWPRLSVMCLAPTTELSEQARGTSAAATVQVAVASTASARHAALMAFGRCDLIIDGADRTPRDRLDLVRDVFFHLRRGGRYLTLHDPAGDAHPGGSLEALVGGADAVRERHGADAPLAAAIGQLRRRRHAVSFANGSTALAKARYYEIDQVLARRPSMGRLLTTRAALVHRSKAVVSMNRAEPPFPLAQEFAVPALGIRAYDQVLCAPHQILVSKGILLPDTYRHYLNRRLTHRFTEDVGERFARYDRKSRPASTLPGVHFYLGSEFPQHFGHVMTEQLSRLWAWPEIKRTFPDARALVDVKKRSHGLTQYEREIFAAAGVSEQDLVEIREPVRVQQLIAAAPMFVNTQYVHPDIVDVWSRAGTKLARAASRRDRYPRKVFVSRRGHLSNRRCTNAAEVEDFFAERGFAIVYPEDHAVPDQVRLFQQAEIVAGFAGSGLFTLCFCAPKRVIVIWPDTYTSRNEYLICAAVGHQLDVFWCASDAAHPTDGWDLAVYKSTYAFDFDRDGAALADAIGAASS